MLSQSSDIVLHGISYSLSNTKIIFLFIFGIIGLCVVHSFVSGRNPSLLFMNMNIKWNNINEDRITSPFHHTLAFIRWNSPHRERILTIDKYKPFFADLHYSMPGYTSQLNYTADGWQQAETTYKVLANTMNIILQNYSNIQGILYFHFDAWINPFRFDNMNYNHIWFPDSNLPPFKCVTDTAGWDWWAWGSGFHNVAKAATRNVAKNYSHRFITDENVFCGGWSDIYYIPRRFFNDFIDLSNIFHAVGSFHEVAVPTMVNILDLTHRSTPFHSVITRIGDCWGDCCANGAQPIDIKRKRCGHRMDLANDNIRKTFTDILDSEKVYLNRTISTKTKIKSIQ